jgi:hypothetical protein
LVSSDDSKHRYIKQLKVVFVNPGADRSPTEPSTQKSPGCLLLPP